MTDLEKWKEIRRLVKSMEGICYEGPAIERMCRIAIQSLEPQYKTPTDDDAKQRPQVEVKIGGKWEPATLYAVIEPATWKFVCRRGGMVADTYMYCRMAVK